MLSPLLDPDRAEKPSRTSFNRPRIVRFDHDWALSYFPYLARDIGLGRHRALRGRSIDACLNRSHLICRGFR
jgi:hypothetical protein